MSPFARQLSEFRMRHGIRQNELAELIGYDQTYFSALEVGLNGPPTPEFVDKLVTTLPFDTGRSRRDLKALNACLAVVKWKKLRGLYRDLANEHHSTYTTDGSMLLNGDPT